MWARGEATKAGRKGSVTLSWSRLHSCCDQKISLELHVPDGAELPSPARSPQASSGCSGERGAQVRPRPQRGKHAGSTRMLGAGRRGTRPRSLNPPLKRSTTPQPGILQRGDTYPPSQGGRGGRKRKLHVPLGRDRRPLPKPQNGEKEEELPALPRLRREQENATGSHPEPRQTRLPHWRGAKGSLTQHPPAGAKWSPAASRREEDGETHRPLFKTRFPPVTEIKNHRRVT